MVLHFVGMSSDTVRYLWILSRTDLAKTTPIVFSTRRYFFLDLTSREFFWWLKQSSTICVLTTPVRFSVAILRTSRCGSKPSSRNAFEACCQPPLIVL